MSVENEISVLPIFPSRKTDTNPNEFSYMLMETMMQEDVENAEAIITKWDDPKNSRASSQNFRSIFQENIKEAKEYINRVKGLRRAMHFFNAKHSDTSSLIAAIKLTKIAMLRLEREFYHILSIYREFFNPESVSRGSSSSSSSSSQPISSEDSEGHDLPRSDQNYTTSDVERAISHLKMIAEVMMSSGYSNECGKIYRNTRKSIINEELCRLGIGNYTLSHINKIDQNTLEHQVSKWIRLMRIAVRTVFNGERILCDRVFETSMAMRQACIGHITMEGAINLFKFPEIVAKSKRSPDKIVILMNLFEATSIQWPEIESIFAYEPLSSVKLQALTSLHILSQSVLTSISEFVLSIHKNTSKTLVPGGGVYPLTSSVMSFVSLLADHSVTFSDILCYESENESKIPFPELYFKSPSQNSTSFVSGRLSWIILVLICKLNGEADLYKGAGLSYLFMANNLQYIVDKVNSSSLKLLLGQEWLSKVQNKVKLYSEYYKTVAWHNLFQFLEVENAPIEIIGFKIKEKLRSFNAAFEEVYKKQRSWVVPDSKLRDEIKLSIAGRIVPAYTELYNAYLSLMREEDDLEVLVKFSPDNIGNYLSDLFHGNVVSVDSPSTSHSPNSESMMRRCIWFFSPRRMVKNKASFVWCMGIYS